MTAVIIDERNRAHVYHNERGRSGERAIDRLYELIREPIEVCGEYAEREPLQVTLASLKRTCREVRCY